jgi:hypothetical protein
MNMKKNKAFFFLWMLVLALTFGLVLSGCPTGSSNPDNGANNEDPSDNDNNGGNSSAPLDIAGTVYMDADSLEELFAPLTKITSYTGEVRALREDGKVITTGTIAAGGALSITLPVPNAEDLDSGTIEEGLILDPQDAKVLAIEHFKNSQELVLDYGYRDFSTMFSTGKVKIYVARYMYADKAVSITGGFTRTEDGETEEVTADINLKPGWNTVLIEVDSTFSINDAPPITATGTMKAGTPDANYKWYLTDPY